MRRLLIAGALLLALVGHALAALPAFDTTKVYTSEAAFAAAIRPYQEAIARNPNDGEAHYWLGSAYLHLARMRRLGLIAYAPDAAQRAVASLETAVRLRPVPEAMLALLEAYAAVGDRAKYDALFDQVSHTLARPIPIR